MRFITFCFAFWLISISAFSQQGKVEGKVTDSKSGNPVIGVSVLVDGSKTGIATDLEGRFILTLFPGKKYTIRLSSIGYKIKELTEVEVNVHSITPLDVVLESATKTEAEVVVTSTVRKETVSALISLQKNTNTVAQVISAEAIRRSPDKNTGEVLKRVPGTSVQEGKYLVVRGLSDRYNQAMLNGILLSSTEPDRKTFSFDIFPSAMIDNIIINKAFVPELPGEWAGGLVQVNTKDIPSKNFLNFQIGSGFNTNVTGHDFYAYKGSNTDFLGFDNKVRVLPAGIPAKSNFENLNDDKKLALGKSFGNNWGVHTIPVTPNMSLQVSGGFSGQLLHKKVGGIIAVNYNRSLNNNQSRNSYFSIDNSHASPDFVYNTNKYGKDVSWGGVGNFAIQLNGNNKISIKNLFNVNATNYAAMRTGQEFISGTDNYRSRELALRTNIFYNTQLSGDHNFSHFKAKLSWYGSFNILDQYIPEQRRLEYIQDATTADAPFLAKLSTGQSQKSGSIFYSNLSDYIYTGGVDATKNFNLFNNKQAVKAGYFFQVKDRLFDSRPFFIKLFDNSLKALPEDQIFADQNFVTGKLGFDEFIGKQFRYIANSILNSGYLQFDNLLTDKLRAVWGGRYENFDQLIGSVKQSDSRHVRTRVADYLPALNLTYKLNAQKNIRLSGSQTVVRPEFRELSDFAFYDFDLGATVLGNKQLQRTKISNLDLRYEIYPRSGELITLGAFFKYFTNPIELYFNQSGAGSSNTFNYFNADKASGYGVEFDIRKKLDFNRALRNFTLTSNLSYIHNRVTSNARKLNRPLQGQSPYVINAGLQYDLEKYGLSSTILFNQVGRRIAFVGNDQVPAIFEAPRPLLDFQLAKKIIKNRGEVKLNISDIINKDAHFYHDLNDDGKYGKINDALAIDRKYGTTFSITFGYNLR
jgi:CarboxypepD_reg-like domain/TonB-dependent Receptor Plug Domain/TonB dependent receptor